MRKRYYNLLLILSITLGISIIWVGNAFRNNLLNTLEPNQIVGPIYRGEIGSSDQFYIDYNFENSGNFPVKITQLEVKILVNGTDYNNQKMTNELASVEPHSRSNIIRVVQFSNTPFHNVEGRRWNITAVTEIEGESFFFAFKIRGSKLLVTSIDWQLSNGE